MVMISRQVRIGSRGSQLALWQARFVAHALRARLPGLDVSVQIIKTKGDKILDAPLSRIGDKGLFTREIENALIFEEIDIAVHSLKDLPTELPHGLALGAVTEREDVRDVFMPHPSNPVKTLLDQPQRSMIATGSLRRKSQLLHLRPDIRIQDIRGNLNTRMHKLEQSDWAGMILARAGVVRLGWEEHIGETLDPDLFLPAVGQGALGIEMRATDKVVGELVVQLHHEPTAYATIAERALLRALEGGCQIPIGAHGRVAVGNDGKEMLALSAFVGSLDGKRVFRGTMQGIPAAADELGRTLAEKLVADGADDILREIRAMMPKGGDTTSGSKSVELTG
jgi:hydroxymethylbilane synthase